MNVALKHNRLPKNPCFQVENTDSAIEESAGISHIEIMNTLSGFDHVCLDFCLDFSHTFGRGTQRRRNLLRIYPFLAAIVRGTMLKYTTSIFRNSAFLGLLLYLALGSNGTPSYKLQYYSIKMSQKL